MQSFNTKEAPTVPTYIQLMDISSAVLLMGALQTTFGSKFGLVTTLVGILVLSTSSIIFCFKTRELNVVLSMLPSILLIEIAALSIKHGSHVLFTILFASVASYIYLRTVFNSKLKINNSPKPMQISCIIMDIGVLITYSSSFFFWLDKLRIGQFILSTGVIIYLFSRMIHSQKNESSPL